MVNLVYVRNFVLPKYVAALHAYRRVHFQFISRVHENPEGSHSTQRQQLFFWPSSIGSRYEKMSGVPKHIEQVDAQPFLPQDQMKSLYETGGHSFPVKAMTGKKTDVPHSPVICLLADILRFKYAASLSKDHFDSVTIADVDLIWFRKYDTALGWLGFAFASCVENPCSFENKKYTDRQLRFVRDYLKEPGDRRKVLFPMTFLTASPILETIIIALAPLILTDTWDVSCSDWDHIMDVCKSAINDHGLRKAVVHENIFCPVAWYLRNKPLEKNSVTCFTWMYSSESPFIHKSTSSQSPVRTGGEIKDEKSCRRDQGGRGNQGGGIMKGKSWRRNCGGEIMGKESWRRNQWAEIREGKS